MSDAVLLFEFPIGIQPDKAVEFGKRQHLTQKRVACAGFLKCFEVCEKRFGNKVPELPADLTLNGYAA